MPWSPTSWNRRMPCFRQKSRIVWCVIEMGGCTGAGPPINMAMAGPKALRDGRQAGPMATGSTRSAVFAMLCLIWGSRWLAIGIGLEGAPPFLSASLRFAVAAIVLVILAGVFRSKWPQNRTEWALVGFVGIVLFTADYGLIYWGENNGVLSGLSAILFATFPLQTALVANAFLKAERFTVQKLLGIGVGFGGVVLIFRSQLGTAGPGQVLPMLSIVLAGTCAAFATVAVKRWGHDTEPTSFNAAAMAVGAAGLATVSLITREPWGIPTWPQGLGAILYLAIAGSVVTFVAWQWLLKEMPATSLSYIALIIPIVAVLLGASLGNETFDLIDLAGAGVVLLGIFVPTSRRAAAFARAAMGLAVPDPDPADPPARKT